MFVHISQRWFSLSVILIEGKLFPNKSIRYLILFYKISQMFQNNSIIEMSSCELELINELHSYKHPHPLSLTYTHSDEKEAEFKNIASSSQKRTHVHWETLWCNWFPNLKEHCLAPAPRTEMGEQRRFVHTHFSFLRPSTTYLKHTLLNSNHWKVRRSGVPMITQFWEE